MIMYALFDFVHMCITWFPNNLIIEGGEVRE